MPCCLGGMELRQLEVFRAVAKELHFGRAAQRLYLAQPSVSQQLRRLEDELGVRLVHRTSSSVRLSPAGTAFLAEADRVLSAVDRAKVVARSAASGQQGVLRIAANFPASRLLLLPLLERLRARSPGVTTMLRELGTADQLRELRRGDLDLALVYGPVEVSDVKTQHLLDVPVAALVRAQHPLAHRDRLSLEELPDHGYTTGYAGGSSAIEEAVLAAGLRCGVPLKPARSAADLSGYLIELETRDTIAFSSLARAEQATGMRVLRIGPVEPTLELHAAWTDSGDEPLVSNAVTELLHLAEERRPRH